MGVEGGWWFEFGSSIRGVEACLPGCVVDDAVVMAAEQGEVVELGWAAVDPVGEVVGVAHEGWSSAGGEGAVSVAEDQGGPDRGGDRSAEAAHVEDLAVAAEDGGDDLGVTGQPAEGVGG